MPIYEYECRGCGHEFEYLVLPHSPAAQCPSCGQTDLEQKISMYAVSSAATRKTNLAVAKKKAAAVQKEKAHEEHKALHEHYEH